MSNRYQNIQSVKFSGTGSVYYVNNLYPDVELSESDNYVITTLGDRFDILANNFYGDTTLWWIIPTANGLPGDSLYPPVGIQLRIPTDVRAILDSYASVNKNR
jgi:hypothetical protein